MCLAYDSLCIGIRTRTLPLGISETVWLLYRTILVFVFYQKSLQRDNLPKVVYERTKGIDEIRYIRILVISCALIAVQDPSSARK